MKNEITINLKPIFSDKGNPGNVPSLYAAAPHPRFDRMTLHRPKLVDAAGNEIDKAKYISKADRFYFDGGDFFRKKMYPLLMSRSLVVFGSLRIVIS